MNSSKDIIDKIDDDNYETSKALTRVNEHSKNT